MRTLIVYSTKYGATKVCAERIAKGIKGEVKLVNLKDESNVSIEGYDNIVIGSPVYAGMLNKHVKKFCGAQSESLKNKKVFLFLSCMDGKKIEDYIKANLSEGLTSQLIAKVPCGGAFYFTKMNFFEKFIIKKITDSQIKAGKKVAAVDPKKDNEMFDQAKIEQLIQAVNRA